MKWKVGQTAFVLGGLKINDSMEPQANGLMEIPVSKVGREYVYIGEDWRQTRFCIRTGLEDGFGYIYGRRIFPDARIC